MEPQSNEPKIPPPEEIKRISSSEEEAQRKAFHEATTIMPPDSEADKAEFQEPGQEPPQPPLPSIPAPDPSSTPPGPRETLPTPPEQPVDELREVNKVQEEISQVQTSSGVIGTPGPRPEKKVRETSKSTTPFSPDVLNHVNDSNFVAATNLCVPQEPEIWVHPETEKYVYAWNLAQLRVGDTFDVRTASRELVLEWIYRNIWKRQNLDGISKNPEAIAILLKMFMFLPTRRVTFMIQRVISALGKYTIRSKDDDAIDGVFDEKTRGAIYGELCNRYEPTRMALYAEVYSELQSQRTGNEALWAPILQAYVVRRI